MKKALLIISVFLTGCANGIPTPSIKSDSMTEGTRKTFVGLPPIASLDGSYAVLSKEWAVTAAHNSPILDMVFDEVYYHEHCDIALFRIDDGFDVKIGRVNFGEKVHHVGYPVYMPLAKNEGIVIGDVVSSSRPNCVASYTDGVIMSGMSGGGVYNDKGELVGVNVGFSLVATKKDGEKTNMPTIFQSLNAVKGWVKEITGIDV